MPEMAGYLAGSGVNLGYPARGLAFIRRIESEDRYAGSRIVLTDQSRDAITRCQFIVTNVGNYEFCADEEECNRPHTKKGEHKHSLVQGDWILAKFRSWGPTPDPAIYVIRQQDIVARFREN